MPAMGTLHRGRRAAEAAGNHASGTPQRGARRAAPCQDASPAQPPPGPCATCPRGPHSCRAPPPAAWPLCPQPVSAPRRTPAGAPIASATRGGDGPRRGSSAPATARRNRCSPRLGPPWTWRARGAIACRARGRHGPTLAAHNWARGSRRAKQAYTVAGHAPRSPNNPSTAGGGRSKGGHGKACAVGATGWSPPRAPPALRAETGAADRGGTLRANIDVAVGVNVSDSWAFSSSALRSCLIFSTSSLVPDPATSHYVLNLINRPSTASPCE